MSSDGTSDSAPDMLGAEAHAPPATAPLIGREHELAELTAALDDVSVGRGRLFLFEGEPGIGKTTLADALSERARSRGFAVLWGRCWEDGGAPVYWPWVQILRRYAREHDLSDLGTPLESVVHRVGAVVPDLAASLPTRPDPVIGESEHDRFAFFDAVSTLLHHMAIAEPLLLVLDDLHTADHDSLRLLHYLARDISRSPLLVIGTYRATDAAHAGAAELLATLGRDGHEIPLRGFTEPQVRAFVERIAGETPQRAVTRTVHDATGGNPFFVDAITRLLVAERRLHTIETEHSEGEAVGVPMPPNVREAIRRRLSYLDDDTRQLLRVASVIGRTFTLAVLSAVTGEAAPDLSERLSAPVRWEVLRPNASTAGRYTFGHVLLRDTLYDELDTNQRAELHALVGTALEQLPASELESRLSELAHHFLLAVTPAGGITRAVEYATRAGRRAMAQAAYGQAATLFEHGLETLDAVALRGPSRNETRCELLLELGAARTRNGDTVGGRSVFLEAAALATDGDMAEQLASAALGYAGMTGYHFSGRVNDTLVALLEKALAMLPSDDSETRVRLLARLAVGLYWSDLDDRRHELSEDAVAMARRLEDPATLAMAIHSRRYAKWGPDDFEQRLADATRSLQIALQAGDLELAASARKWRITDLLEFGDTVSVDHELDAHDTLAQRLQQPFLHGLTTQFRALRAIMRGDFAEGEQLAQEARAYGDRAGDRRAHEVFGMQMLPAWRQQVRHDDLRQLLHTIGETAPPHPAVTSTSALIHIEMGDRDQAAMLVEQLVGEQLKHLRHDMLFLYSLAFLALTVAELGDIDRGERLYGFLQPYAGRIVVAGAPAQACWGPVDHYLGLLAALGNVHDRAVDHFHTALELEAKLGSAPLLAETRYEYGLLLRRHDDADQDHANALLAAARSTATDLGMIRLTDRLDAVDAVGPSDAAVHDPQGGRSVAHPAAATELSARGSPVPSLRRSGDYWVVETERGTTSLHDMKGLQYLAVLLSAPGRRHHVLELSNAGAAGGGAPAIPTAGSHELDEANVGYAMGYGDAGELLDDTAKAAYRQRVEELEHSIAEAEEFNDLEHVSQLRAERDMIIDQLTAAVGLGGRDRRAASASERARVNVTRAIRSAIRRIGDHDPAAGRRLDDAVVTGTYCVFDPDRDVI